MVRKRPTTVEGQIERNKYQQKLHHEKVDYITKLRDLLVPKMKFGYEAKDVLHSIYGYFYLAHPDWLQVNNQMLLRRTIEIDDVRISNWVSADFTKNAELFFEKAERLKIDLAEAKVKKEILEEEDEKMEEEPKAKKKPKRAKKFKNPDVKMEDLDLPEAQDIQMDDFDAPELHETLQGLQNLNIYHEPYDLDYNAFTEFPALPEHPRPHHEGIDVEPALWRHDDDITEMTARYHSHYTYRVPFEESDAILHDDWFN